MSHVKIVIMRQALGGRRISRIDMPPQAERIEMIVCRIIMKTFLPSPHLGSATSNKLSKLN
jgi:hypothetical protein